MGISISKDKLDGYRLNLLLIHDTYTNNDEVISKKMDKFMEKYNQYNKQKENYESINSNISNYAKIAISYSLLESGITNMYHLFEQFLKIYYNVDIESNYKKTITIANTYEYNLKDNEHYEVVEKYRLLNNAIKHGGIENLRKKYPSLINNTYDDNDYGTILDDKLNITENELDECCSALYKFVEEMNTYFEDMGYLESDM